MSYVGQPAPGERWELEPWASVEPVGVREGSPWPSLPSLPEGWPSVPTWAWWVGGGAVALLVLLALVRPGGGFGGLRPETATVQLRRGR